jgi:hypothetical protein
MNMSSTTTNIGLTKPVTLPLFNLDCSTDAQVVVQLFKRESGVVTVYANPATEKVYIEYEVAFTNPDRLKDILQKAGFGPRKAQVSCGHRR